MSLEHELAAGEALRAYCNDCDREFELTYEPKAQAEDRDHVEAAAVEFCPFCGSNNLEE